MQRSRRQKIFQGWGGQRKKDRKIAKKAENSTFKHLLTIFVPCLKIQGGHGPLPPAADAHGCGIVQLHPQLLRH